MQKQNTPGGKNNKPRNTSYFKSHVGKKPKKESSAFLDIAKKRQINNYRLAIFVLFILMLVFGGIIWAGSCMGSMAGSGDSDSLTGKDDNLFASHTQSPPQSTDGDPGITDDPTVPSQNSEYNGVYLNIEKIESLSSLQSFIDNIKAHGINAVNIDIKKEDGSFPFYINDETDAAMKAAGRLDYIVIPIDQIIELLRENGLYVSGTIACFKDNYRSGQLIDEAIKDSSVAASHWKDADGNNWLNPYSNSARNYISGILAESVKLGFDEIILSWFFFPTAVSSVSYGDDDGARNVIIGDFIETQRQSLDDIAPHVKLGLNIPLNYFLGASKETTGLDPNYLIEKKMCNFLATSFSPHHVTSSMTIDGKKISDPESEPYETVSALCSHFKYIYEKINFRPYLQVLSGFGNESFIAQRQALDDSGIKTFQLVNDDNNY